MENINYFFGFPAVSFCTFLAVLVISFFPLISLFLIVYLQSPTHLLVLSATAHNCCMLLFCSVPILQNVSC